MAEDDEREDAAAEGPPADEGADPFEALPDAPADDGGDPFAELAEADRSARGAPVAGDPFTSPGDAGLGALAEGAADVETGGEAVVEKRRFCERCRFFAAPPEMRCTHPQTEIVELVDVDRVRVANCPVVARRRDGFGTGEGLGAGAGIRAGEGSDEGDRGGAGDAAPPERER